MKEHIKDWLCYLGIALVVVIIVVWLCYLGIVVMFVFINNDAVKGVDDIDKGKSMILVMDTWEEFPWKIDMENATEEAIEQYETWVEWWDTDVKQIMREIIAPLLKYARENGITIVFSNMVEEGWNSTIDSSLGHKIYNEPIINLTGDLVAYMKGKKLDTILYVGFATNNCILGKPTGMKAMNELGYDVVLLKDCSLSGAYQSLTDVEALALADEYGLITTSDEVIEHFGEIE